MDYNLDNIKKTNKLDENNSVKGIQFQGTMEDIEMELYITEINIDRLQIALENTNDINKIYKSFLKHQKHYNFYEKKLISLGTCISELYPIGRSKKVKDIFNILEEKGVKKRDLYFAYDICIKDKNKPELDKTTLELFLMSYLRNKKN